MFSFSFLELGYLFSYFDYILLKQLKQWKAETQSFSNILKRLASFWTAKRKQALRLRLQKITPPIISCGPSVATQLAEILWSLSSLDGLAVAYLVSESLGWFTRWSYEG